MITYIGHLAFKVSDLKGSLKFYCDVLGLEEAFRMTDEKGDISLVYIKINENNFIELFTGGKSKIELPSDHIGYSHLCLLVDDINTTLKELSKRGLSVPGEPKMGGDGNWQYWIADPDGNSIEFMQIMPDSLQAKAGKRAS